MNRSAVLKKVESFVRKALAREGTGHDWYHIAAVRRNALAIARRDGGDRFLVELGALLHETGDGKIFSPKERIAAMRWLSSLGLGADMLDKLRYIIDEAHFSGAGTLARPSFIESAIVQDADRLEALGAIGIARVFATGGKLRRPIHDPAVKPKRHRTLADYRRSRKNGTSVNHFYEKILLLKDRMHTRTGRVMAKPRHVFVQKFLKEFFAEWNGKA